MTLKNTTKKITSSVPCFLFGTLITVILIYNNEWFKVSELNLSNLLSIISIIINIGLAVFVVTEIKRIQDIRRIEKDILINRINSEVEGIKRFVQNCCKKGEDFSKITGFLKTSKIRLNKIVNTHGNCEQKSRTLFKSMVTLNSLLTDPKGSDDLKINDNKVSLMPRRIQEINIQMAIIENSAFDLTIHINRCSSKD